MFVAPGKDGNGEGDVKIHEQHEERLFHGVEAASSNLQERGRAH